jgi:hypothetical protein
MLRYRLRISLESLRQGISLAAMRPIAESSTAPNPLRADACREPLLRWFEHLKTAFGSSRVGMNAPARRLCAEPEAKLT